MSIVFTGGGTFGPTTSLVPLIKEINDHSKLTCHFIASEGSPGREIIESLGVTWNEIPAGKLQRYFSIGWLFLIPNVIRGFLEAGKLLERLDTKIVVTSGSFVSPPVIWQAKRRRIASLSIQLDVSTGLAQKIVSPFVDKKLYSFKTNPSIDIASVVGPIIRTHQINKKKIVLRDIVDDRLPILFVTGGGTGAKQINELLWKLVPPLSKKITIIHITGKEKGDSTIKARNYIQVPFLEVNEYYHWLSKSTVVIGRSGMGFFSDVIAYQKAVITIPLPRSQQEKNAQFFLDKNAVIAPKHAKEVNEKWLLKSIENLLKDRLWRNSLGENIGSFAKEDTVKKITTEILQLHG
jgi:UDP-N-acetylglucosamine--N-acetylmuramyl-(pentapeptide) pyrophosphoryl-undecaprenol N-acetylglucosamine transferase